MKYEHLATTTAYADAKGLPYEAKTKQQIEEFGGVVSELIAPDVHSSDFPDFQGMPVGTWSDDTQHTLAMMESLATARSFNLMNLAHRLRTEMDTSDAGWGGATKRTIEKVDETMSRRDLARLGEEESMGCGPLMRLTPLVIFNEHNPDSTDTRDIGLHAVYDSTTLTHCNFQSMAHARTHADILRTLIKGDDDRLLSNIAWYASEAHARRFDEVSTLHSKIARAIRSHDLGNDVYDDIEESFASWCVQAVAYVTYDRNRGAPFNELIDAVIAEGGDTDSTAALIAGMWVCEHPDKDPGVDIPQLQQSERLVTAGKAFAQLIASQSS